MGPQMHNVPFYGGSTRASGTIDDASAIPLAARVPAYYTSDLGPWPAVITYEACVRLCLNNCSPEAGAFLKNKCSLLRDAFSLDDTLLQPEEDLLIKEFSEVVVYGVTKRQIKTRGKLNVQVRKIKMVSDQPSGCTFQTIKNRSAEKFQKLNRRLSFMKSRVYSEWEALSRVRVAPVISPNASLSAKSLAYIQFGTRYLKDVSGIVKVSITSLHNASTPREAVQETCICSLKLKSYCDADVARMQAGSSETHVFFPDGVRDDLIIEVNDSKGKYCGHAVAQLVDIADDMRDTVCWWPIYHEPDHELVGKIQLNIHYSSIADENNNIKRRIVAEAIAYDSVLEAAMKAQSFKQKNLLLRGEWGWLVTEFVSYYGVSDAYTKLRYLSYVMDVATPTADCLNVVHDLLSPVIQKCNDTLSSQENRMLGSLSVQIEETIALVFENYKSLDENSPSGLTDTPTNSGSISPALKSALKLYALLHDDIESPEAKLQLCRYFQTAVRKIVKRHLAETNECVPGSGEKSNVDQSSYATRYEKMKSFCINIRDEIVSDTKIHSQHVLPTFVDLPILSTSLYSIEVCKIMRAFLVVCPPISLAAPPVTDLIITTCDLQKDLYRNISPVKGGVNAKALFDVYITKRADDKHHELRELCKLRLQSGGPQQSAPAFVDDMYKQLGETLGEFEVIISRWPEYTLALEKVIADTEREMMQTLEKEHDEFLSALKENTMPVKAVQYVQRIVKGNLDPYSFPEELGTLFNLMKKMLDVQHPELQNQFKSHTLSVSETENAVPGELLSEVTVMLKAKFRNKLQGAVEKLSRNTKLRNATNLKKIIQEAKEGVSESDIRNRMQPLKDLLTKMIRDLHGSLDIQLFISFCQALWDQIGEDVLKALTNEKENTSYKSSRLAVSVLNETFMSEMQALAGRELEDKDVEAPRSIIEVQSMLCQ